MENILNIITFFLVILLFRNFYLRTYVENPLIFANPVGTYYYKNILWILLIDQTQSTINLSWIFKRKK